MGGGARTVHRDYPPQFGGASVEVWPNKLANVAKSFRSIEPLTSMSEQSNCWASQFAVGLVSP